MIGRIFNRLTVVSSAGSNMEHRKMWNCVCSCGARVVVLGKYLRNGNNQSCGCLRKDNIRAAQSARAQEMRASMPHRPTLFIWKSMIQRCTNANNDGWARYGGRGITVCPRWMEYEAFLADMGEPPEPGFQLDRINNDGGYEPGNCRWVSLHVQGRNKRSNVNLTYEGETMVLTDWAIRVGITAPALKRRIKLWGLAEALTTPSRGAHHFYRRS